MNAGVVRGFDPLALFAAVIAAAVAWVYVGLMQTQDDRPLVWVLAVLGGAAVTAAACASTRTPYRRTALCITGSVLLLLGVLAIFSIGLPILVAGALALLSALRQPEYRGRTDRGADPTGRAGR
jgi:hypothetical protein